MYTEFCLHSIEEDIKLQFITPAILAKWNIQNITMETPVKQNVKFTDGKINIKDNIVSREKAKKADYILYINSGNPIAIVEASRQNAGTIRRSGRNNRSVCESYYKKA